MSSFKNKTVLITGGASGIGRLMGEQSLALGASNLIIWDINKEGLATAVKDLKRTKAHDVNGYVVDVSDVNQIEQIATKTILDNGPIDILINNAGIVTGKKLFGEHTTEDIQRTFDINVLGVMHVTRVFLPDMIRLNKGHIVNIASASSLIGNPNMSVYASSKWAVLGWSESLRLEMDDYYPEIKVTTICPSYIDTGMFKGVKAPLLFPLLKPQEIVDKIIDAIQKDKEIVMAPDMVNFVPALRGILPPKIFDFFAGKLGVYSSMDSFVGKKKDKSTKEKVSNE